MYQDIKNPIDTATRIPRDLTTRRQWVVWKRENGTKVPYRADRPYSKASSTDAGTWTSYEKAAECHRLGKCDTAGIGFVFTKDDLYTGIDFDDCLELGELKPWAVKLLAMLPPTYAEVSPSGKGIKLWVRGIKPAHAGCKVHIEDGAIEVYDCGRFFTVTGDTYGEPHPIADADLSPLCSHLWPVKAETPKTPPTGSGFQGSDDGSLIRAIRRSKQGDKFDRLWRGECEDQSSADLALCNILAWWTAGDSARIDRIFRQSGLFRDKWDEKRAGTTYGQMTIDKAISSQTSFFTPGQNEDGSEPSRPSATLIAETPYDSAAEFVRSHSPTLLHHRGDFYCHDGRAYRLASDDRLRSEVYPFINPHFAPTRNNVGAIIDALKARTYISEDIEPPAWVGSPIDGVNACDLLPMANGILHLPSRTLHPHTPALFTTHSLTFDFNPAATCNAWLHFLDTIWNDDPEQIETLREWIGYLISGQTNQQKIALIVGPKRSGKGTIARILTELLGHANCCNPTLNSLSQNFGMQPLIGKLSAIISDARLGGRADQHAISERLLNTSGEDSQTVDRKHRDPWTGKLGVRFTIMSNELPRLSDSSGALSNRFIVLTMKRSFFNREDTSLTQKLLAELPGIFNWSLAGLDTLAARGRFVQPQSSRDAVEELNDLSSPILAFVRDRIVIEPTETMPTRDEVYNAWESWCETEGRSYAGNKSNFARELRTAIPEIQEYRPRTGFGGPRPRYWKGFRLKTPDELDI